MDNEHQQLVTKILDRKVPFLNDLSLNENKQLLQEVVTILNQDSPRKVGKVKEEIFRQWQKRETPEKKRTPVSLDSKFLGYTGHQLYVTDNGDLKCICNRGTCILNSNLENLQRTSSKSKEGSPVPDLMKQVKQAENPQKGSLDHFWGI